MKTSAPNVKKNHFALQQLILNLKEKRETESQKELNEFFRGTHNRMQYSLIKCASEDITGPNVKLNQDVIAAYPDYYAMAKKEL